jgi:5-methylcytosine-specific restriction enzyme subunit McrC
MVRLYELFVSEWLSAYLPDTIALVPQERAHLDDTSDLYFDIDLVLRDISTGEILCVLDTKYKDTSTPAIDDVAQIVAYAEKMGCQEAILVYPRSLPRPFDARVGDMRVRSLSFSVGGDVDEAGHRFMDSVLDRSACSGTDTLGRRAWLR